ncbi:MAG: SAM-dependent methyltransferase [Bacteroidetes bacterium]|nr:SAM-dependent methyltransferase [Bacteroidota bacterium]
MADQPTLIVTSDGSHSLRVESLNETYHSVHGALQEARHVFLKEGFYKTEGEVSILEIGFGTGLNAFLTMLEAHKKGRKVNYTGIEKFPVPEDMIRVLNYGELLGESEWFDELHVLNWGMAIPVSDYFTLTKIEKDIADIDFIHGQEEEEEEEVEDVGEEEEAVEAEGARRKGKGQVKRDLRAVGFDVENVPGPPGKREMIRAVKR